jgi:hypothetical protein
VVLWTGGDWLTALAGFLRRRGNLMPGTSGRSGA